MEPRHHKREYYFETGTVSRGEGLLSPHAGPSEMHFCALSERLLVKFLLHALHRITIRANLWRPLCGPRFAPPSLGQLVLT